MPTTFWILLALGLYQVTVSSAQDACVYKSHTWSHGYVAKLYLNQDWLTGSTLSWNLTIVFNNKVKEFKIWDADIAGTTKNYVLDTAEVTVTNKCYNPILYSCQFLELSYLVRFPDDISNEGTTDYDIQTVLEAVSYNDGSEGTNNYATFCDGQPTASPGTTVALG